MLVLLLPKVSCAHKYCTLDIINKRFNLAGVIANDFVQFSISLDSRTAYIANINITESNVVNGDLQLRQMYFIMLMWLETVALTF